MTARKYFLNVLLTFSFPSIRVFLALLILRNHLWELFCGDYCGKIERERERESPNLGSNQGNKIVAAGGKKHKKLLCSA